VAVGEEGVVDDVGEAAFEDADRFEATVAVCASSGYERLCSWVDAELGDGDAVQGCVELAVSGAGRRSVVRQNQLAAYRSRESPTRRVECVRPTRRPSSVTRGLGRLRWYLHPWYLQMQITSGVVGVSRVRTTLNLDAELVAKARLVLGTDTATATIHAALARVIAAAEVAALLDQDFSALDDATIADLRTPRSAA
jgi:Arc/MetJ family transcription regulator